MRRSVDFTLEAGNIDEVVTVEADPIAVDLTSATSGTIISGDQVHLVSTNQPVSQGGNGSSTFGQVTSWRDPRAIHFGAKFSF